MASYWAVSRKLHSTGGSSSGSGATEPTRVDAHAPQLRRKLVTAGGAAERLACYGELARAVAEGVSLPSLPDAGIGKWILDQELDPIDDTLNIFAIFGSRIIHP